MDKQPIVIRHEWSAGARIPADAERVAAQLAALTTPDEGLSLETVIDASQPEDAPLHAYFEWSDEIAAHLYRLRQAGHAVSQLRRISVSTVTEEELPAERVYIPRRIMQLSDGESAAYAYIPVSLSQSDDEQMERVKMRALDRVERLAKEFRSIRALSDLAGDLEDLLLKWR